MKWTTLFILGFFFQGMAHGYGQGTISLSAEKLPLEKVLLQIGHQSGNTIWFEDELLANEPPITILLEKVSVEKALDACLRGRPLRWKSVDKLIVISRLKIILSDPPIQGTVIDEKGEPLIGATVRVKSSGRTVLSDAFGKFELLGVKKGELLLISFTGYNSEEVSASSMPLVVRLTVYINKLDEIQVIGYGTTTRRLNTGSVATITKETISLQPVSNVLQAISGRMTGVQIIQANGMPGSPMTVQVRGQNSIAANNNPLYVVDGVPWGSNPIEIIGGPNSSGTGINGNPLNAINPADIESVEVLKDADATAIYGSRGANGVVLITTKKGIAGKTRLDLDFNMGAGELTRLPTTLGIKDYLALRRTAFQLDGITPTTVNAPDLLVWDTSRGTDWQEYFYGGTAQTFNGNAAISGGNAQTKFLLAGGFYQSGTVLHQDDRYQRSSVHMSMDHHTQDNKFQITFNSFYTSEDYREQSRNGLRAVATLPPNFPAWDATGKINWSTGLFANPFANRLKYYRSKNNNLNAGLVVRYQILPGLQFRLNMGYNSSNTDQLNATPAASQNPAISPKGSSTFGDQGLETWLAEPLLTYQFTRRQHQLTVLVGGTYQQTISEGLIINAGSYSSDLLLESLADGTVTSKSASSYRYKYLSLLSRLSYNFGQQYLLSVNLRRDGSSRFGPGNQFGNFGSVAAAWIFSNHSFFKNHHTPLSFGKLRASYGTTGNDPNSDYAYLSTYQASVAYAGVATLVPARIANADFQWEVNRKLEWALETGWWKDRVLFTVAWYQNRSDNQLVGYPLPTATGFSSYQANFQDALVQNKGWELDLTTVNLQSKELKWTTTVNVTLPSNELLAFPGIEKTAYANTYVVGYPLTIVQRFVNKGIDPTTGLAVMEDLNKDNAISAASSYNGQGGDYRIAGKTAPRLMAGLSNHLTWKNFQLDIFLQYVNQEGSNLNTYYFVTGNQNNVWSTMKDYWREPGQLSASPRPTSSNATAVFTSNGRYASSDASFSDASFVRVKNIAISYELPESIKRRLAMSRLRLYGQAQNLFTFTNYTGYDPETLTAGADMAVPPLKNFVVGIQCSF